MILCYLYCSVVSDRMTGCRTASVTAASTSGGYAVNGSAGSVVVNSRPMAGPPGPSPQRTVPQSFTRPTAAADNVDRRFVRPDTYSR